MLRFLVRPSLVAVAMLHVAVASAVPENATFGLADSEAGYRLVRSGAEIPGRANSWTRLAVGDRVRATEDVVRIMPVGGGAVLLDRGAEAEFPDGGTVRLLSGAGIFTRTDDKGVQILADDLRIAVAGTGEVGAEGASNVPMFSVSRTGEEKIRMRFLSDPQPVRATHGEAEVAALDGAEALNFVRTEEGWTLDGAEMAQADAEETAAGDAATGEPDAENPEAGTIYGHVIEGVTGEPIIGAKVTVVLAPKEGEKDIDWPPDPDDDRILAEVYTDEQGYFEIHGLPIDSMIVYASKAGFFSRRIGLSDPQKAEMNTVEGTEVTLELFTGFYWKKKTWGLAGGGAALTGGLIGGIIIITTGEEDDPEPDTPPAATFIAP